MEDEMKTAAVLLALLGLALLAGCSGIKVSIDYNRDWDFNSYRTYDWVADSPPVLRDPLIDTTMLERRVKNAVDRELNIKGYRKSKDSPDFWVAYHVATQNQVDVSTCGYHYPTSPHCWGSEVETYSYTKGTLLLDIIDSESEELVWRGSAESAIYDVKDAEQTINQAVKKMLKSFPPG
jgi:hypothetical protein